MPISEDEYKELTDNIHAFDIRDQLDNAKDPELSDAFWNLYQNAKNIIDAEYCGFDDDTNDLLLELHEDAEEVLWVVSKEKERIDAIYEILSKITEAIPGSVFEE